MNAKITMWWMAVASLLGQAPTHQNGAATPTMPNFSPGPEYADSARMHQGIPSIERAKHGRLWVTWYGGGVAEDEGNYVMLATS